ncbi:hypothetical protein DMUE_5728 [Dictyocoela muelleri]|nr:hypothetical protein DMUE_5728 [Dictyocoela muelleri]
MNTEGIISSNKYTSLIESVSRTRMSRNIIVNQEISDISESIKMTSKGKMFNLYDSRINSENRIIILSTNTSILHLSKCRLWIADGTFRSFIVVFIKYTQF